MTGGHDPFWGIAADGPFEVVKAVRNQIRKGARVIKISATGGVYGRQEGEEVGTSELTCEEIRAICQEAHRFGLKVAAHAISEEGIRNCIEAGVDTIEHGHFLNQELILKMKEKEMSWVPTLYVYQRIAEGDGVPEYAANKARKITGSHGEAFRAALNLELPFGAGSDAGSPNTPHGALLSELETMVACGCHPFSALQSATFTAARALGLEREIGALDVGKKADILILEKDPTCDIANLRNLRHIIKDGVFVER
jgi:imidazolonepropionase-like amidohydrolase